MTQRKELLVRARKFAATKKKGESLFCIESEAFDGRSVGLNHELLLTFMTDFAMEAVRAERESLAFILEESVKLQSHYAELLNMHDGGQRRTFSSDEWIARLKETGVSTLK